MTSLEPTLSKIRDERKPRHRLASLGNPKKKNVPYFSVFRGGGFFLEKCKDVFLWGSALQSIRAVWRGFNADSVLPNYFLGLWIFAKPRLNFPPAGGVWGGTRAGFGFYFFKKWKRPLLNCYRFRQVSRFVHIKPSFSSDVISQEL